MDNSEHTHRLSFSESVGSIVIGSLLLFVLFIPLRGGIRDIISGDAGVADYLGALVIIFGFFPIGLSLLARPFIAKVVVKSFGIEYHSAIYILVADWKNLVNVGHLKNSTSGKSLVIVPREGKVTLRNWARPLSGILRHNPRDVKILVSQFRASNGHSFETDVLVNVSQRGELSTELESV